MFSLITTLSAMLVPAMSVNAHFNTHNFIEHQLSIRTNNELSKKYSENSFLKNLKLMSYSYRGQSMNSSHRKSIQLFLFSNDFDWT